MNCLMTRLTVQPETEQYYRVFGPVLKEGKPVFQLQSVNTWDTTHWDEWADYPTLDEAQRAMHIAVRWHGKTQADILRRYPRLCAHIIAHSLGYATPNHAALLLKRAYMRMPDWCEWLEACYRCDAAKMLRETIDRRHGHKGFMGDARVAYAIIQRQLAGNGEPIFASWF